MDDGKEKLGQLWVLVHRIWSINQQVDGCPCQTNDRHSFCLEM